MTPGGKTLRHWLAATLLGLTLTIGVLSLIRSVGTIGDPFSGFFFGPNLLVSITQRASWPGPRLGLKSLDRILSVDGRPLRNGLELAERISQSFPGELKTYRVVRGDEAPRDVTVPVTKHSLNDFLIGFLAPFMMGLLFLIFAGVLYFAQPGASPGLVYLVFSCLIAAFLMAIYEAYTTGIFFRVTLLYPLIGALSAHLFSAFPTQGIARLRVRAAVGLLYGMAGVLVVWRQAAMWSAEESVWLSKFSSAYVLTILVVDALLLVRAYQLAPNQTARDRIKVAATGVLIACSLVALWSLNFLRISQSFYLDEGVFLASVFPLFMAYAVLRRNVFGLDRVIRLTLSYGVAAAVVFTLYLLAIGGLRTLEPKITEAKYSVWVFVVLAGLGAYLFNLLRGRVNRWVHRLLFRGQYDLASALSEIDRTIRLSSTRGEIAESVTNHLARILELERLAFICIPNEVNAQPLARFRSWPDAPAPDQLLSQLGSDGFLKELGSTPGPIDLTDLAEEKPEAFGRTRPVLLEHRVEMVVPLLSSNRLHGLLLLGRKLSKERFDRSDFRLLHSTAVRLGTVLENADLAQGMQNQARLAALGKMSSILVHDIKNPLSTIRSAAQSLKRRFRPGEHSHELTTIIEDEVDRMNRAIAEILTYAKPAGLNLTRCSVNEVVGDVASRLKPVFKNAKVRFTVDLCDGGTAAEMDTSLVHRALENLLMNARDATPEGGEVRIATRAEGKEGGRGRISVVIEDTGEGMDSSVRERIFEPFYTTKPSGTGLGLALVKQIVAQHGGEIDLETRPGRGTRFTLRFPPPPAVE